MGQLAAGVPINANFADQLFEQSFSKFSRITRLFQALSLLAVLISATGLFGMAVHVANRRVHEIGVRKSLGAATPQVVLLLLRDFSKPVLIANLIAWPIAWIAARSYLGLFMQQADLTPWPFAASMLITLAIAWLAVGGQTFKAGQRDARLRFLRDA